LLGTGRGDADHPSFVLLAKPLELAPGAGQYRLGLLRPGRQDFGDLVPGGLRVDDKLLPGRRNEEDLGRVALQYFSETADGAGTESGKPRRQRFEQAHQLVGDLVPDRLAGHPQCRQIDAVIDHRLVVFEFDAELVDDLRRALEDRRRQVHEAEHLLRRAPEEFLRDPGLVRAGFVGLDRRHCVRKDRRQ
jgi:hypothetical protein